MLPGQALESPANATSPPPEKRRHKTTTCALLALSADAQTGGRRLAEGISHLVWPDGPAWHAQFSQVVWSSRPHIS